MNDFCHSHSSGLSFGICLRCEIYACLLLDKESLLFIVAKEVVTEKVIVVGVGVCMARGIIVVVFVFAIFNHYDSALAIVCLGVIKLRSVNV